MSMQICIVKKLTINKLNYKTFVELTLYIYGFNNIQCIQIIILEYFIFVLSFYSNSIKKNKLFQRTILKFKVLS